MLVWKNQNPWTALRGQFYDVFLEQNGGFYGQQHGAKPLHIQLNLNDTSACVINQTLSDQKDFFVIVELFDIHGKLLSSEQYPESFQANSVSVLKKVGTKEIREEVFFLRLRLKDKEGQLNDGNFYWLAKPGKSYEKLNELKPVVLQMEYRKNVALITNPTNETAFFIRLKVFDGKSGELALPVFMSDNYFSLLPGEKKEIAIDGKLLPDRYQSIRLEAGGFNVTTTSIKME
jgi:hypothetical protein